MFLHVLLFLSVPSENGACFSQFQSGYLILVILRIFFIDIECPREKLTEEPEGGHASEGHRTPEAEHGQVCGRGTGRQGRLHQSHE